MEILANTKSNHWDLRHSHVWGCPMYVQEAKFQNKQNLPKWNRQLRLGQFLGFSEEYSTLVANVCHLQTGYISPRYHLVFDDFFETAVRLGENDTVIDNIFK